MLYTLKLHNVICQISCNWKKKAILAVSIKKNVKKYFKEGVEARAKFAYKRVSHFV